MTNDELQMTKEIRSSKVERRAGVRSAVSSFGFRYSFGFRHSNEETAERTPARRSTFELRKKSEARRSNDAQECARRFLHSNDEIQRNTEIRMKKPPSALLRVVRPSSFGFLSSFVIRHSSFNSSSPIFERAFAFFELLRRDKNHGAFVAFR